MDQNKKERTAISFLQNIKDMVYNALKFRLDLFPDDPHRNRNGEAYLKSRLWW